MTLRPLRASEHLHDVKYEIRGALARRAEQLEREGHEIVKLNIGNPGAFGFRMPGSMRVAIVENLHQADPYSHQKGIFPAREAVVMQQQNRGVMDVTADDVFIGNGVSELIDIQRDYRVSYHALTRQYRVSVGALALSYPNLAEAMRAVASVRGWPVAEAARLRPGERYRARLDLRLDSSRLPKPLQINLIGPGDWSSEVATEWEFAP